MKYEPFKQRRRIFCVPACLQVVLKRRGIKPPTQRKIFRSFERDKDGVRLTETNLNAFLRNFRIESRYEHPQTCFTGADFELEEAIKRDFDILVAYQYSEKHAHVSLISSLYFPKMTLQDPREGVIETTYDELTKLMGDRMLRKIDRKSGHGFYFIS